MHFSAYQQAATWMIGNCSGASTLYFCFDVDFLWLLARSFFFWLDCILLFLLLHYAPCTGTGLHLAYCALVAS